MNFAQIFFMLFILLKPFYILPSGSLQLGDLMILGSFTVLLFNRQVKLTKIDIPLLFFTVLVAFINVVHMLLNNANVSFITPIMFYIFSFITVLTFRTLAKNKKFLISISNVLKLGLLIQVIIFILGLGRYFGPVRYMGTFNDPNQMGFFAISSVIIILLISEITHKYKFNCFFVIIAVYLVFETASTGILLAVIFSLIPYYVFKIKSIKVYISYKKMLGIIPIVSIMGLVYINYGEEIIKSVQQTDIVKRVEQKIDKAYDDSSISLIEERVIDRVFKYPEYAILGAGEGANERFPETTLGAIEIHSTFPNILFNYGILGICMITYWIYQNIKKIPLSLSVLYFGIFIESFTLVNQRQPFFWIMIILGFFITREKRSAIDEV